MALSQPEFQSKWLRTLLSSLLDDLSGKDDLPRKFISSKEMTTVYTAAGGFSLLYIAPSEGGLVPFFMAKILMDAAKETRIPCYILNTESNSHHSKGESVARLLFLRQFCSPKKQRMRPMLKLFKGESNIATLHDPAFGHEILKGRRDEVEQSILKDPKTFFEEAQGHIQGRLASWLQKVALETRSSSKKAS